MFPNNILVDDKMTSGEHHVSKFSNGMKVISIGSDRGIFREGSAVRDRIKKQGEIFDEFRIVVFSLKGSGFKEEHMAPNIWVYPTNSASRWLYVFDAARIAEKLGKADVITCQDPFESGLAGWLAAGKLGAKLHLQIHTDFLNPYFWRESLLNKIRVLLARFLLPKADGIRVVSNRIKNSLKTINYKLKTIPFVLPVYVDIFGEKIPEGLPWRSQFPDLDFIFLVVSRLEREKGVALAVEIMAEVVKEYPHSGMVVVGEGGERIEILKKISRLGLEKNVYLLGQRLDARLMFKDADACVVPSYYEGYGLVLIEAATAGCPIISTDVGLVGDILVQDKDLLVCPVGDSVCLAGRMKDLLKGKDKRNALGYNARESALKRAISLSDYLSAYKNSLKLSIRD